MRARPVFAKRPDERQSDVGRGEVGVRVKRGIGTPARYGIAYGALLALGTLALQWLDYQRFTRAHAADIVIFLVALGCLALGVWIGARVLHPRPTAAPFDGNPKAQAALGISARELDVLRALAAGRSNKEIAIDLDVSPNTVKTHVARLFEKLGAKRRTDAINRARELGIVR
jgi:DNA-binding CsgD family transcriptional regulator